MADLLSVSGCPKRLLHSGTCRLTPEGSAGSNGSGAAPPFQKAVIGANDCQCQGRMSGSRPKADGVIVIQIAAIRPKRYARRLHNSQPLNSGVWLEITD